MMDLLDAFKLSQALDFPQLGWRPKEESIRRIIKEIQKRDKVAIKPEDVFFLDDWPENVVPVKDWGATALLFGQDVQSYGELLQMLKKA
jgi:predicted phosphatase